MTTSIVSQQSALWHSPGRYSAVVTYDAGAMPAAHVRARAADVMRFFAQDRERQRARALVALSPRALEGQPGFVDSAPQAFPPDGEGTAYVKKPADVLVQLSSEAEVSLRRALRVVGELLAGEHSGAAGMRFVSEVNGCRIFNGEEAFGFRDGVTDKTHIIETFAGFEQPGAWVLFQLYRQDVRRFFSEHATAESRATVLGRAPHALPVDETDVETARSAAIADRQRARAVEARPHPNSHWGRMRSGDDRLPMVRRGFPCRVGGEDGLAFVAVAGQAETFAVALARMLGQTRGDRDRLLSYIEPVDGHVYFWPSDPDWLVAGVPAPRASASAKQIDRNVPLDDYLVVRTFLDYLMRLRHYGLFDDRDMPSTVSDAARPHLDALYRALADAASTEVQSPTAIVEELRQLEQHTIAGAVALNAETDEYVSFG